MKNTYIKSFFFIVLVILISCKNKNEDLHLIDDEINLLVNEMHNEAITKTQTFWANELMCIEHIKDSIKKEQQISLIREKKEQLQYQLHMIGELCSYIGNTKKYIIDGCNSFEVENRRKEIDSKHNAIKKNIFNQIQLFSDWRTIRYLHNDIDIKDLSIIDFEHYNQHFQLNYLTYLQLRFYYQYNLVAKFILVSNYP